MSKWRIKDDMKELNESVNFLNSKIDIKPTTTGIILGSGLGDFVARMANRTEIDYQEIPHFGNTTVVGHAGKLVYGDIDGAPVLAMQGRFHLYEGHPLTTVVLPTRVMALLGCKRIIVTNASGGINPSYHPGDLILIKDHINFMGTNPLIGKNYQDLGPRFPDMTEAYDPELREIAKKVGSQMQMELKEGVYAGFMGPSYETPAEINMLRIVEADLVGMSTVPEVIAANHAGVKVLGISCVTNYAAGISPTKLDHSEVKDVANKVMQTFGDLVSNIVKSFNQ